MAKIVIIDDNSDSQLLIRIFLEPQHEVVSFSASDEFMRDVVSEEPDLILMDISVPGHNGFEMVKWLRKDSTIANTPVIAFTANALRGDRDDYLNAGFDDFVSKPVLTSEELLAPVRAQLALQNPL